MSPTAEQITFVAKIGVLLQEGTNAEIQFFLHDNSEIQLTRQQIEEISKIIANQYKATELLEFFTAANIDGITIDSVFEKLFENCWQIVENPGQFSRSMSNLTSIRFGNLVRFVSIFKLNKYLPEVIRAILVASDLDLFPFSHLESYLNHLREIFPKQLTDELTAEAMAGVAL